jgi:hypothetical protein
LAVADEIRRGPYNVQTLSLKMIQSSSSKATEAVKAVASAIRSDQKLKRLYLQIEDGFTDEAGVALAEAMLEGRQVQNEATLGIQAYEAFSTMLRVNTSLLLKLPPLLETDGADERLVDSRNQRIIEQRLNEAGRGRLLRSSQTPKEE